MQNHQPFTHGDGQRSDTPVAIRLKELRPVDRDIEMNSGQEKLLYLEPVKSDNGSLSLAFLKKIMELFHADIFVETGTNYRGTTAEAAKIFREVHTIELSRELFQKATQRLRENSNVHLYHGDSSVVLQEILPLIQGKPVFWLDGHYSGGETARGNENTPIMGEIQLIWQHNIKNAVILIDDIRIFYKNPNTASIVYGYPTIRELFSAILEIDNTYCFEIIGDVGIAYPSHDAIKISSVIRGCTISRFYDENPELGDSTILKAEQNISYVEGVEQEAIGQLCKQFSLSNAVDLSKYYTLWFGLILYNRKHFTDAIQSFTSLLSRGFIHWRIQWYLARAAHESGNFAIAQTSLFAVLNARPDFKAARKLMDKLKTNDSRENTTTTIGTMDQIKILFYCGIHNLVNFSRIRPYYDICYGFDANPDKVEQARKFYQNDPNVKIIYGALTEKGGEEIEFVITTDWTPASSIGQPNPDYVHMKTGLLQAQKKIKVPTINLQDFCSANGISEIDTLITDLQGIDFTVLKTLSKFIKKGKIREIQCEVEPDETPTRYLGIPPGKLKDFNKLLSGNYDILWMNPLQPPEGAWEMDVRWRVKNSCPNYHIEFVIENELLVPVVKSYLINSVYGHHTEKNVKLNHKGNVSVMLSAYPIDGCDVYVYHNAFSYRGRRPGLNILLMLEPAVVLPGEFDEEVWKHFDHIFGLFDTLKNRGKTFHKIFFPRADFSGINPITEDRNMRESHYPLLNRKDAICMISGNKSSHVPYELYSKRIEVAHWFAKHSKIPFDVYGRPSFALPNYCGAIPDGQKLTVLKQYRFSLCFENTNDPLLSAGYVTEKILDCLETRTIPIYLGASNIEQYIPPECFIDFRKFADYRSLDTYLHSISKAQYNRYIDSIDDFVCSGGLRKYSEEALYNQIIRTLIDEKSLDAKYFNNDILWHPGPGADLRHKELSFCVKPTMWSWKYLSKATSPSVQNGKIIERRQIQNLEPANSKEKSNQKSFLLGKKSTFKILIADMKFHSGRAKNGYSYGWWNIFDTLNRFENIQAQFFDYASEAQQWGVAGMSERLAEKILKEKPDLLLYQPAGRNAYILPGHLQLIADSTDTQIVLWSYDKQMPDDIENWCSCLDHIITTSKQDTDLYVGMGFGGNIIQSQWAFNPFTYISEPSPAIREISFCGSAKGIRSEILNNIKQNGLPVDIFGPGWHKNSFVPFYDLIRIFNSSRINLHLGNEKWMIQSPLRRHFEVTGCGGFLITTPANNLEEYYEPDKEVVVASSLEEMIDKCKYYLTHENQRAAIARRGYERTLAEHTWTHRLVDIFKHIGFNDMSLLMPPTRPVPSRQLDTSNSEKNLVFSHYAQPSTEGKSNENILVSIIVNAYNQLQYTKRCVESILNYTNQPYELLLSDNGSTDGTSEYFEAVRNFHPNTRIIRNFKNRIVESALNYAASIACGKYIIVVSNDNVVHKGWLDKLIQHIESAPDIGIVVPRSNSISGPQAAPADYDSLETFQSFACEWSKNHQGENFFVERMVGMLMTLKKDILKQIGGFDPDLPTNGRNGGYGFSDDEFSLRLRLKGYRLLVANDVFIHHFGSATVSKHRLDLFGAPQNINKEKFINKIKNNSRISIAPDGKMTLRPYSLEDMIPVDERMVIRTPRICLVETGDDLSDTSDNESRYIAVAQKHAWQIVQNQNKTIQSLILKMLAEKQYDFLVLIDSRLAPTPEIISALTESVLCYPDVAIMVPVGNYAPITHARKTDSLQAVEIIPYADLSLCAINLKIIRPLRQGLARCENDNQLLWFLQRRVRGESYFIAKANNVVVDRSVPVTAHPYDVRILPEQLIKEKKYTEAIAVYHDDLRKDPNFTAAHYQLACIAREQGRTEEAIKHAEQALRADPHHIESLIFLASLFMKQNNWKQAELFVGQANFKQPGNPDVQKIVAEYEKAIKENNDILQTKDIHMAPHLTNTEFIKGRTSIIVAASSNHVHECLISIKKHTQEPYELIVLDSLTSVDLKKKMRKSVKEHSPYKILEHSPKESLLQTINQGINYSIGEYIVLLSDDTVVSKGWLTGMLDCLNRAPNAGIIGPMTNNSSSPQEVKDESYQSVNNLTKYTEMFKEQYRHRRIPCRNIAGFCMLFKRTLAEKIGLLDERFDISNFAYEDFCLRAALEGYSNYIAGDVFIHHYGGKGSTGNRSIINKKWTLSTVNPEGKKLAIVRATESADDLYSKGQMDQAIATLINCIKLNSDAKEIYYELARMFIESKRYSEAWEVVGTMPEAAKNDLKGLECAGYAKEGLGLDDEVVEYADKMLSLNRNYPAALNLKGILAYKKSEKEKAADYFQSAINNDPGYGEAYTNLGVLYWGMDKKDEALTHLHKGFILSPTVPDVSSLYYSVISSLGLFGIAEVELREASKLYPSNKNLAFLYIDLLIQQSKYDFAMLKIEDALELYGLDEGTLKAALTVREQLGPLQIDKTLRKTTLSVCMIVKNEEKHLVKCLKSIRDIVDEMIIVDTGSTDKTIDIARIFGAKVFDFPWTGDFSEARNHSLDQASGDWILILDADEVISPADHKRLLKIIDSAKQKPVAFEIISRNYLVKAGTAGWTENDGTYPQEEKGVGWSGSNKVRLIRNNNLVRFENPVHELLEASLHRAGITIEKCDIPVHHYGRLDQNKLMEKGREYYLLGKKKLEERGGGDYIALRELAAQAGELGIFEEAIALWQQALSVKPDDVESLFNLGYHYMQIGKYLEARNVSKRAVELSPGTKNAVLNYALSELYLGNALKATVLLDDFLSKGNYNPTLMAVLGASYCAVGNSEKGVAIFKELAGGRIKNISYYIDSLLAQLISSGQNEYAKLLIEAAIQGNLADQQTLRLRDELTSGLSKMVK